MIKHFLLLFCLLVSHMTLAQQKESTNKDSLAWTKSILPVAFYVPETSFAAGATGILTFKKASAAEDERASQILFAGFYTAKKQIEVLSYYEIYANKRKHRFKGEIAYYKYSYNYFGIGPDSKVEDMEKYDVNFPRFELNYAYKFYRIFNIGTGYRMDNFDIRKRKEGGLLDTNQPVGWEGGFKSNLMGIFFIDTRDNINAPLKGFYSELVVQKSLGILFSDFDYTKVEADIRFFKPFKATWVFAQRINLIHTSDGTPFYDLALISTATRSRGFDDRRFLNNNLLAYQAELRIPIAGRFRAATFFSYNIMPESWTRPFDSREFLSYGAGLRYTLREESRTGIRFDLARGDGKFNFYVTLNEAF